MEKYVHPIFSCSGCRAWREKRVELLRVPGRWPRGGALQRGRGRGGGRGRLPAVPFCRLLPSWNCLSLTHSFRQTVTSRPLVWERRTWRSGPQRSQRRGARGQTSGKRSLVSETGPDSSKARARPLPCVPDLQPGSLHGAVRRTFMVGIPGAEAKPDPGSRLVQTPETASARARGDGTSGLGDGSAASWAAGQPEASAVPPGEGETRPRIAV